MSFARPPATAGLARRAAPVTDRPLSSRRDDLLLLGGAFVLVLGLFSDGWAHSNIVDDLESFITPYHAGIFLGFALTAAVVGTVLQRNRAAGRGFAASVPEGYGPAVAGIGMFALGFVGDGLWHTAFGIEAGIDALLSPTHLLMFAALLALFTSPWRAAAARPGAAAEPTAHGWAARLPEVLSVALTTLTVAFFVLYLWVVSFDVVTTGFTDFVGRELSNHPEFVLEVSQMAFLAGSFVMTVVLVAPLLVLVQRMPVLPRGVATALLTTLGLGMAAMREFQAAEVLLMFPLAGATADVVAARRWSTTRARLVAVGTAVPLVLWSAYWVGVAIAWSIGWVPELWSGQIVFATMVGAGLALLVAPRSGSVPAT
jgi:hypothetical protein